MKRALLWERVEGNNIKCHLCERHCLIEEGKRGFCRMRVNKDGELFTLSYGNLSAIESRPIEIKPFYHFYPGTSSLTISTYSCNFPCPWCQNWHLSKEVVEETRFISPQEVINMAVGKDQGICVSFNEPTLLYEYCFELFPLAKKEMLYTCIVSNGYMTVEALEGLREAGLDAIKIDIKGVPESYEKFLKADAYIPWRNAKIARELGMHLEIVSLMVSSVNDSEEAVNWVIEQHLKYAGESVPLHFTRYFPAYHFHAPPTDIEKMEWAYREAKRKGVKYVYIGNIPGHRYENTYCPSCGMCLISRYVFRVLSIKIKNGRCPNCGEPIPVVMQEGGER
ncbi:AmmeMemoRadiSam system radical SAM enzyme [bacterium]|nr:AmmeMemoRadiSam system radical SAM enzyme [bacterium]